jgi:hypothetical protein
VWAALAAVAGLTGASAAALALVRHQGVRINGDEPQYLVEAESIGRFFTVNMSPGYNFIITHHIVYPFTQKPGPGVAGQIGQALLRHQLYLPIHSIGLSALLAVPILAGPNVAVLAFMLMLAALAVGIVHLVGQLAGARSPWRFLLAGLFLAPTYLLASTQVYPDILTGMIIAVLILLIARFEVRMGCTTAQIITAGLLLAVFPWLAEKNILTACILVVVLLVTHRRTVMTSGQLAWLAIPTLVSGFGVVVFNLWAFGHPLGSKNPVSVSGIETWTRSSALLFDRRSGILIQLPLILLGLAALWAWRRRIPLAVIASMVIAVAVVYGNGTEPGSQTGGSFAGRYEWTLVPLLVGFAALYLIDLWRVRKALVAVVIGAGAALSVIEAVPVVLNEHLYYSQVPWDPAAYRGWWGGLDPSPVLGYLPGAEIYNVSLWTPGGGSGIPAYLPGTIPWGNARDLWGLACVLLLAAAVLYCLVAMVRAPEQGPRRPGDQPPRRIRARIPGALLGGASVCLALTLTSPILPPAPVTFAAASLASQAGARVGTAVVARGPDQAGDVVLGPFWELLPGRYVFTIRYVLHSIPEAAYGEVVGIERPPGGKVTVLQSSPLSVTATSSRHPFVLTRPDEVAARVRFGGFGTVEVESISLAKVAPG